ncbi:MAG TPA: SpoIID/LytB domain-containing protein [Chloroflexota bacterium]|jgi:stage II sporulation protein D
MLSRRRFMAVAALGLSVGALPRWRDDRAMAESGLIDPGEGTGRVAQAATTGPPSIPTSIRLQRSDGSFCSIGMEEYLKGVVPAEMPATWPIEALKAQAVAARTYAASYVATYGYICATTACQVWDPSRRHANADAAVDATRGELITYQGGMIWAYYSSTCGGQTQSDPGQAVAYCQAVRCWREPDGSGRAPSDLSSEAAAAGFWGGAPAAFCSASPAYRYGWNLSRAEQEQILDRYLPAITTVSPRYSAGQLGQLRDLLVAARSFSGKATLLRVVGSGGTWDVSGELAIRSLLRSTSNGSSQRSANVVLTLDRDAAGITRVNGRGGGFGHGIGLCQSGAKGMAEQGYDYATIVRHYYSGISLVRVATLAAQVASSRHIILPMVFQGAAGCEGGA